MYQHRWVMYCKYNGKTLDHWDGSNAGYMSWILDKWREFSVAIGITEYERSMYHKEFDKWLLDNTVAAPGA